jgi:NAD(P)-dependent dehydrogenase (short-subunit alcohol dehydrogenase family)
MEQRLSGKTAIITGAAGGIGSEMSRLFAAHGCAVVVADINRDGGEALVADITASGAKAAYCQVDISSSAEVRELMAFTGRTFGGLDVLVNNAAYLKGDTTLADLEEEAFDRTIAVCLKGSYLCSRAALPLMQARGRGSIVTISSVNALFSFGHTAYTAAKGGLISMMRLIAAEYGHLNIRSNIICPGTIQTELSMRYWESNPAGFAKLKAMYPMGRLGTPADVAGCALYLASDEAQFVTGSVFVVDGGLLAGQRMEF